MARAGSRTISRPPVDPARSRRQAERWFEQAVQEEQDVVAAWGALIRVRAQRGHIPEARATLERARSAGLPRTTPRVYEALIAALEGDARSADRALADVPGGRPVERSHARRSCAGHAGGTGAASIGRCAREPSSG